MSNSKRKHYKGDEGEGEEEEVGGFVKTVRTKKGEEDNMGDKRTKGKRPASIGELRNPGTIAQLRETNAPSPIAARPATTSPVPAVIVKKEGEGTVSIQTANQPTRARTIQINGKDVVVESCPVCGGNKPVKIKPTNGEEYRPITCKACKDRYSLGYVKEVTAKLLTGTAVVLTWHQWVLEQLELARFGQELNAAFKEKERLNGLIDAEIKAKGRLTREVFISLRNALQEKVFEGETLTSKAAYGKWRRIQERLKAATEVRPQVEKMVAEEAARSAPPAATAPAAPPPLQAEEKPTKAKAPRKRTTKAAVAAG